MSDENTNDATYSEDYVKELRKEAASWRTKFQESKSNLDGLKSEVENKDKLNKVSIELSKRGIKADPSWVKVDEGQSHTEAIDKFLENYPHLADGQPPRKKSQEPKYVNRRDTNLEDRSDSSLESIKKDPVERSKLRNRYRDLLRQGTVGSGPSIY